MCICSFCNRKFPAQNFPNQFDWWKGRELRPHCNSPTNSKFLSCAYDYHNLPSWERQWQIGRRIFPSAWKMTPFNKVIRNCINVHWHGNPSGQLLIYRRGIRVKHDRFELWIGIGNETTIDRIFDVGDKNRKQKNGKQSAEWNSIDVVKILVIKNVRFGTKFQSRIDFRRRR